jgi:hypothetical protein
MRYRPKNIAALHVALGGLPEKMRVDVEADLGALPKTVGELRKLTAWPENVVVTTPQERHPDSTVRVSARFAEVLSAFNVNRTRLKRSYFR